MRKLTTYLIICLLCCVSCAKNEREMPGAGKGKHEFAFSARLEGNNGWMPLRTRGDFGISDLRDNASGDGWGVFAYYTGTSDYTTPADAEGVIFNKRRVWWDGTLWQYYVDTDHKKEYWPMDAADKVSFFAYGPYKEYNGSGVVTVDSEKGPQVKYIASTDLSAQKDLLWGTNTSGLPHRNVNLATYADSVVDMHFRHAPAKIHFTINGATLGNEPGQAQKYGNPNTNTTYGSVVNSNDATGGTYSTGGWTSTTYTLYYAYRQKTVVTTQVYRQNISGFKILMNRVEMTNFIKNGILHLNNPDAYVPYWEMDGNEYLDYTFNASDMVTAVTNPGNESTLVSGWGTTYLGVDSDPKELLPEPDNYIYMVPKQADTLTVGSQNISITAYYHVIGLTATLEFTRTTTTVSWERVPYYSTSSLFGGTTYYYKSGNNNYSNNISNAVWEDFSDASHPSSSSFTDTPPTNVGTPVFNYSQDNDGAGFKAVGSINSDILGGRDYTINLYLDGRELRLTVIPQQWDLYETVYDYNSFINPVEQSLTYDSDFVYEVIGSNVYINNRMGKFYFKLGSGMYLYWQASLIGDDAFAFTDANGEYLRDSDGNLMTSIRGDIGDEMNYIYIKAINTASQVTSKAKLRIYLFNSENRAVVALPKNNWLFVSSSYLDGEGQLKQVQEWSVVQSAN